MKNVIEKRYEDDNTTNTPSTVGRTSPMPNRTIRTNIFSSPTFSSSSSNNNDSSATIISDITFQTPTEEEKDDWTDFQRKKIIFETENVFQNISINPCCGKNCISNFTLETIKHKRYTFHHLNNENKRHHLNLCRLMIPQNRTKGFVIDGKSCCVECATRVLGISRKLIYQKEQEQIDKPLDTKSSNIVTWLLDLAGYSERMPDQEEFHIPYMNKVN